ncbi:hypothetical protein KFZ76_01720 [Methylovulum psychrotolerans]|uniref:hypothetical protein n=1 Tax=Methylovulum psychrotolerans TaxID=1704499 RepID=UPI001BFF64F1|nr:hypothetical protein [Methylovulum psychrotolerans]MBT9096427.1 hypothetical protein [Methylovulum psychrotolerans]
MKAIVKFFVWAAFACWPLYSGAAVEMTVVTPSGVVAFTVEEQWQVLSMQPTLPIAAAVFQLPNQADEGTADSTNLILQLYDLKSPEALQALQKVGQVFGAAKPKEEVFKGWVLYRQDSVQDGTAYSVIDAKQRLKTVAASVRLAWPHLKNNPAAYDAQMVEALHKVLLSVQERVGPWRPESGAVIRRPEQ